MKSKTRETRPDPISRRHARTADLSKRKRTPSQTDPKRQSYEVTVVGTLSGERRRAAAPRGRWINHRSTAGSSRCSLLRHYPATVEGCKYLGSGLVYGVGSIPPRGLSIILAEILTSSRPTRSGCARWTASAEAQRPSRAWEDQKQIKEIMLFLQGHVSTSLWCAFQAVRAEFN